MYLIPMILSIVSAYPSNDDGLSDIGNDRTWQFGNALCDDEGRSIGDLNVRVAVPFQLKTLYCSGDFDVGVMISRHVCNDDFEVLSRFLRTLINRHTCTSLLIIRTREQQQRNAQCRYENTDSKPGANTD